MSDELGITTENARQAFLYVWQTSSNNTHKSATSSYRKRKSYRIEKLKVDLKQEVGAVIKQKVKVDVNPQDIL